jgi:hypothetical protein
MDKETVKRFLGGYDVVYSDLGITINCISCKIIIDYEKITELGINTEYIYIKLEDGIIWWKELKKLKTDLEAKDIINSLLEGGK